jgi:signal transduction histidine kinase
LRAAAMAASLAEEGERRKLASDLHDDAGQLLSLAALKLASLKDGVGPALAASIVEVTELVADVRRRISSLSFQLSPPLLHDLGLVAAVQWLAEDLERSYGLHVAITDQSELELDETARVTLFRAARELLFNVAKHAGVKHARVRIWSEGRAMCVAVEDAGVGLPPQTARQGFGLLALRERLEQLGGTLETRATPGGGTTVVATLLLGTPSSGTK